jgi:uncharacterized metal-binding protein YceD (DUF177 family)
MEINIKNIPAGISEYPATLSFSQKSCDLGGMEPGLACRISVCCSHDVYYLTLVYQGIKKRHCDRCLAEYDCSVEGECRFILVPEGDTETRPDDAHDMIIYGPEDETVEIESFVYSDFMVQIPVKSLCRTDCSGISLPRESKTPPQGIDGRWKPLLKIKKNTNQQ